MAIWQSSQLQGRRQAHNLAGGLNNGSPAFSLQDNQSIDEYGWDTDQYPALHTRRGRIPYGATGSSVTNLLANFNNVHLFRVVGSTMQYDNAGTWTTVGTLTVGSYCDSTNFNDKLIFTNGSEPVKVWDGTAISDLSTSAPTGKYITNDTVRVWIAKNDVLYFSAFLNETDWTTAENSGSVQYYTPSAGDITGLARFANHICIFKKDSFAEIFGTDYFTFRLIENSNDIGCISYKTIVEVGDTLFWLGENDVYAYKGGKPVRIGQPIRKYLDSMNVAGDTPLNFFGGTDGIRYYLGISTGTNQFPNVLLEYDPRYGIWRVSSLNDNFTFSANFKNEWYTGNSTGQTYKMNQGTSDNGTAILWSISTKDFDEGIPEAEKEYYELHLQATIPTGTTLSVSASTNQGTTYTQIGDPITTSNVDQNINIIIPLDTVPLAHWIRFKFEGTGEIIIHNIERYFRVQPVQH